MTRPLADRLHQRTDFSSRLLAGHRELTVYLPPSYEADHSHRFPVMYIHDAQNVFRPETAYVAGNYWHLGESADYLIAEARLQPLILVGVAHGGERRIDEFTPSRNPNNSYGGQASVYGRMLVEEIMPFVNHQYRTAQGAKHTGLGGSSLGGLVTMFLGVEYPETFGRLAVMSPSVWWDYRNILRRIVSVDPKHRAKIWLDVGLHEGNNPRSTLRDVRLLRDVLQRKGWQNGSNLFYYEDPDGGHDEGAWARRAPHMLQFLFPGERAQIELPLALAG